MTIISNLSPSVGLIVVVSLITITTTTGSGRRRRTITTTKSEVNLGTGFNVDGELDNNGLLKNQSNSNRPIVASVAHIIPKGAQNRYFMKLFDKTTKNSIIYELSLIALNYSVDLCLYDFESFNPIDNPLCLQWETADLISGNPCYLIGYPLGDAQQSIVHGSIRDPTYCFSDLQSGLDQIYHSAPATNGNSGSCILNMDGKVIGIHSWGYNQMSPGVDFENFVGGPSTHSIFKILSYMLLNASNPNLIDNNKFFNRVILGIFGSIITDIFRIVNMNIPVLKDFDGIMIKQIIVNKTIDLHNKRIGTTKIEINDIITHIQDLSGNYIQVGYTKESPVNILFLHPLSTSLKIKIRKANQNYQSSLDIELINPVRMLSSEDTFYSNIL
jgi:hypothetical protein